MSGHLPNILIQKCINAIKSLASSAHTPKKVLNISADFLYTVRGGSIKAVLSRLASLAVIQKRLESGEESRTRLARWVCGRFQLPDVRGKPRVSSCPKALRNLEREGKLQLPPPVLNVVKHW